MNIIYGLYKKYVFELYHAIGHVGFCKGDLMAYVIAKPCVGVKDTACVDVCPMDCIHPTKNEPDFDKVSQLFIDADHCIDCDLCASECPVAAIFAQDDLPVEWQDFLDKNARYFRDARSGDRD